MRTSKQKELILTIINSNYSHPSAQEIYLLCRSVMPNISLGTVYRNLNTLTDEGMILRIKANDNIDRYDHIDIKHSHFMCVKCDKIYDIDKKASSDLLIIKDHKVIDYEINYKGICKECLKEKEK